MAKGNEDEAISARAGPARSRLSARPGRRWLAAVLALLILAIPGSGAPASVEEDEHTAEMLAEMLRAARTVVAEQQGLINDPEIGDKQLTGDVVLAQAIASFEKASGIELASLEAGSRDARLMAAVQESIREVVDEHQSTINAEGIGFKGFIPAIVGRLITERFGVKVGDEALMRVTAPVELVRNRRARPDSWEASIIESRLTMPDWPTGQPFSTITTVAGREAFRVLVPEYYTAGCLACHGEPQGEIDVTGYPKEGGKLDQLGGVISITLFR